MRKDRLAYFKKRLVEKQRQLTEEVGRTALYGKDAEDDSIKDLGDQANTAYTREFFFELGNGDRRLLRDVVSALQKLDDGAFGSCERCNEADFRETARGAAVRASLHRLPAGDRGRGADGHRLIVRRAAAPAPGRFQDSPHP
jgi:DnaK suppressor protein